MSAVQSGWNDSGLLADHYRSYNKWARQPTQNIYFAMTHKWAGQSQWMRTVGWQIMKALATPVDACLTFYFSFKNTLLPLSDNFIFHVEYSLLMLVIGLSYHFNWAKSCTRHVFVDSDGLVPSARTFGTTLTETVPGAEFALFLLD